MSTFSHDLEYGSGGISNRCANGRISDQNILFNTNGLSISDEVLENGSVAAINLQQGEINLHSASDTDAGLLVDGSCSGLGVSLWHACSDAPEAPRVTMNLNKRIPGLEVSTAASASPFYIVPQCTGSLTLGGIRASNVNVCANRVTVSGTGGTNVDASNGSVIVTAKYLINFRSELGSINATIPEGVQFQSATLDPTYWLSVDEYMFDLSTAEANVALTSCANISAGGPIHITTKQATAAAGRQCAGLHLNPSLGTVSLIGRNCNGAVSNWTWNDKSGGMWIAATEGGGTSTLCLRGVPGNFCYLRGAGGMHVCANATKLLCMNAGSISMTARSANGIKITSAGVVRADMQSDVCLNATGQFNLISCSSTCINATHNLTLRASDIDVNSTGPIAISSWCPGGLVTICAHAQHISLDPTKGQICLNAKSSGNPHAWLKLDGCPDNISSLRTYGTLELEGQAGLNLRSPNLTACTDNLAVNADNINLEAHNDLSLKACNNSCISSIGDLRLDGNNSATLSGANVNVEAVNGNVSVSAATVSDSGTSSINVNPNTVIVTGNKGVTIKQLCPNEPYICLNGTTAKLGSALTYVAACPTMLHMYGCSASLVSNTMWLNGGDSQIRLCKNTTVRTNEFIVNADVTTINNTTALVTNSNKYTNIRNVTPCNTAALYLSCNNTTEFSATKNIKVSSSGGTVNITGKNIDGNAALGYVRLKASVQDTNVVGGQLILRACDSSSLCSNHTLTIHANEDTRILGSNVALQSNGTMSLLSYGSASVTGKSNASIISEKSSINVNPNTVIVTGNKGVIIRSLCASTPSVCLSGQNAIVSSSLSSLRVCPESAQLNACYVSIYGHASTTIGTGFDNTITFDTDSINIQGTQKVHIDTTHESSPYINICGNTLDITANFLELNNTCGLSLRSAGPDGSPATTLSLAPQSLTATTPNVNIFGSEMATLKGGDSTVNLTSCATISSESAVRLMTGSARLDLEPSQAYIGDTQNIELVTRKEGTTKALLGMHEGDITVSGDSIEASSNGLIHLSSSETATDGSTTSSMIALTPACLSVYGGQVNIASPTLIGGNSAQFNIKGTGTTLSGGHKICLSTTWQPNVTALYMCPDHVRLGRSADKGKTWHTYLSFRTCQGMTIASQDLYLNATGTSGTIDLEGKNVNIHPSGDVNICGSTFSIAASSGRITSDNETLTVSADRLLLQSAGDIPDLITLGGGFILETPRGMDVTTQEDIIINSNGAAMSLQTSNTLTLVAYDVDIRACMTSLNHAVYVTGNVADYPYLYLQPGVISYKQLSEADYKNINLADLNEGMPITDSADGAITMKHNAVFRIADAATTASITPAPYGDRVVNTTLFWTPTAEVLESGFTGVRWIYGKPMMPPNHTYIIGLTQVSATLVLANLLATYDA